MSFKRDGDDREQLHLLRQRRIQELLGEKIPEDEAKLLSNGKFTCTVCSYNPVFDTVDTLLVHRQGKKHAAGAAIFADKQRTLKDLIEARKVEHFEKYGNTNIKIAAEHLKNKHLMISTPYDARTKKIKPYDRKFKVTVLPKSAHRTCNTDSSRAQDLPGSSCSKPKWGHLVSKEPVLHDPQLKNIFRKVEDKVVDIKPYKSLRHLDGVVKISHHSTVHNKHACITQCDKNSIVTTGECRPVGINVDKDIITKLASHPPPPPPSKTSSRIISEEEKQYAAKLQQLRGAGWKRDWDGKWIKDEDAEFDTDEDAPDL